MKYFVVFVFVLSVLFGGFTSEALAQNTFSLRGKVIERKSNKPIGFATVVLKEVNKWSVTTTKGEFHISKIEKGTYTLCVSCLGYKSIEKEIHIDKNIKGFIFDLEVLSLGLDEVVVTAKQNEGNITSVYDIKSDAIEHAQIVNISEIMSLLPGGQTRMGNLVQSSNSRITLRSVQGEEDCPSFGTAIVVDGVRLSSNGNFGKTKGVDPRIVSPDNIARVRVIAGVPSVEYGDLISGLVKITTKQGVMPLSVKLSSSPKQKQVSLFKGFKLGEHGGILNISYDYTKAISNIASPYTSFKRNAYTIRHKKVFGTTTDKPIVLNSTLAGNFGGYNSESDPDNFKDTYTKKNAFNIRGGFDVKWNLNTKLISEINFGANINYTDNKYEEYSKCSSASGRVSFHGTEEGYFVGKPYEEGQAFSPLQLVDRGHWYQTTYIDGKPVNYGVKVKIQKNSRSEKIINQFKLGGSFMGSGNEGRGEYYGNKPYTPNWREHRYSDEPYLNNLALYVEESFKYFLNKKQYIHFVGGIRSDNTFVKDSKYGDVSAFSPRFNIEYSIVNKSTNRYLKKLNGYVGWGKSVKLPSFNMLYIRPTYLQRMAFVPGSLADGTTYFSYHIQPNEVLNNKSLKWQESRKVEIGFRGQFKGISFSVSYFNTLGKNNYTVSYEYSPFIYYLTTPNNLVNVQIPVDRRKYSIDQQGTVTVHDNTGTLPNEVLDKKEKRSFKSAKYANNGSPVKRHGLDWVLDFGKIKPLQTSVRIDGAFYYYKYLNKKITAESLGDNQLMSDGRHYQYIGYYYGGDRISNGKVSKYLHTNATLTTHIPKLKLVFTIKLEGTFINSSRILSEMPGGERSFELDKRDGYIPKPDRGSIYDGNNFVGTYPLYYTSFDDMNTKISFREKYLWAYENDKTLFNDLTKMVKTSNYDYLFKKNKITSFFSSNINVSKEVGQHFKLTFYARNFLNNMSKVKRKQDGVELSLLNGYFIPSLSYGISLKVKL